MMSNQYKRELTQIVKDVGKIRSDIGREEENARKARVAAMQKRASGRSSSSLSTRDSYGRQAEAEDRKVEAAEKKIGTLSGHAQEGLLFDTADPAEPGDRLVGYDAVACGSAWKRDPGSGVIGVEKGPLIPVV